MLSISSLSTSRILYFVSLLSFYWYHLTFFIGPDGHLIAIGILTVFIFIYWIPLNKYYFYRSTIFYLTFLIFIYFLFITIWSIIEFPSFAKHQIIEGFYLIHMGGIASVLIVPWLIGTNTECRLNRIFILLLISFFCNVLLNIDFNNLHNLISQNGNFRMNPNTFGFLSGVFIIGICTILLRKIIHFFHFKNYILFTATLLFSLVSLILYSKFLLISQSRSGWIAFFCIFPISLISLSYLHLLLNRAKKMYYLAFIIIFLVAIITITSYNKNILINESSKDNETLSKIVKGNLHDLPQHSVGKRIELWKFALLHIQQRPFFGWGPGTVRNLLDEHARNSIHDLRHVHNTLFQLLFQVGLVGLSLFVLLFILSFYEIILAYRYEYLSPEWFIFLSSTLFMYLIYCTVNSPFDLEPFRKVLLFIWSISLSLQIKRKNAQA